MQVVTLLWMEVCILQSMHVHAILSKFKIHNQWVKPCSKGHQTTFAVRLPCDVEDEPVMAFPLDLGSLLALLVNVLLASLRYWQYRDRSVSSSQTWILLNWLWVSGFKGLILLNDGHTHRGMKLTALRQCCSTVFVAGDSCRSSGLGHAARANASCQQDFRDQQCQEIRYLLDSQSCCHRACLT